VLVFGISIPTNYLTGGRAMKTILKKIVLLPLLAVLATAPICTGARADLTLALDEWVLPVVLIGGATLFVLAENQKNDSWQRAYVPMPTDDTQPQAAAQQSGYVVQPAQAATMPVPVVAVQDFYYCPSSKKYYPYVRSCAVNWEPVSATPPQIQAARYAVPPPP
jgi:hypothetical protein